MRSRSTVKRFVVNAAKTAFQLCIDRATRKRHLAMHVVINLAACTAIELFGIKHGLCNGAAIERQAKDPVPEGAYPEVALRRIQRQAVKIRRAGRTLNGPLCEILGTQDQRALTTPRLDAPDLAAVGKKKAVTVRRGGHAAQRLLR